MTLAAECQGFLSDYQSAFESLDPERIAPFYGVPSGGISADKVTMLTSAEAILDNFKTVTADLRRFGLVKTRSELGPLTVISDAIVEVPVDWTLLRADGSTLKEMKVVYVLWRSPVGLKIALVYVVNG